MIELRHLRYFVAVAEELNFRRASERVYVDSSALSRAVRELEAEVGAALFARTSRSLHLTAAGSTLLEDVREVLVRLERAKRKSRETDESSRSVLRIGVA